MLLLVVATFLSACVASRVNNCPPPMKIDRLVIERFESEWTEEPYTSFLYGFLQQQEKLEVCHAR